MKFFSRSYNMLMNHIIQCYMFYLVYYIQIRAIFTFPSDQNEYKRIILENNIEVMLIVNENINKSICSISISTGSIDDTIPGIAHLVEHLLFMGTVKFPEANAFNKFVEKNNGYYNAQTSCDITNFHFNLDSENFFVALEMLSCFFYQPLFTDEAIISAINAINEEFYWSNNNEMRLNRLFQVCCNGPYSNFLMGNRETLNIGNIREKVLEFWEQNYDSSRMKLVIFHNEDIEDKIKEYFEHIPMRSKKPQVNVNCKDIHKNLGLTLFTKEYIKKYIFYQSCDTKNKMTIYIEIPYIYTDFKNKSIFYIKYLLNEEDVSSLTYQLKEKNLAFDLKLSIATTLKYSYCIFEIHLTKKGCENYEDVVDILYYYLNNLNTSLDTFKKYFEINKYEFCDLENTQSIDYYINLANILQHVPYDFSIYYLYICEFFNENEIKYLLDIIKNTEKWLVFLSANDRFIYNSNVENEKYYNIKYFKSTPIKINDLNPSKKIMDRFFSNKNNEQIKVDFDLEKYVINKQPNIQSEKQMQRNKNNIIKPTMDIISLKKIANIKEKTTEDGKCININDKIYNTNTVYITILFNFEVKREDYVKLSIYLSMMNNHYETDLKDDFKEKRVDVKSYLIKDGFRFNFFGFYKNIVECIRIYIKAFKTLKIKNFIEFKNKLIDKNKNYMLYGSQYYVYTFLEEKIISNIPYNDELLGYCKSIQESDISLKHEYFIELFAVSNIDHKLIQDLHEELKKDFMTRERYEFKGNTRIDNKSIHMFDASNNAVGIFIHFSDNLNYKSLAGLEIITSHFSEKFYDELRTKEKIGYNIKNFVEIIDDMVFYNFIVVSTKDCRFLEERILNFIDDMKIEIKNFTEAEFDNLKRKALISCDVRLINRCDYFNTFYNLYHNFGGDTNYYEKLSEAIKNYKIEDLEIPENKIIVQVYKGGSEPENKMERKIKITKENDMKQKNESGRKNEHESDRVKEKEMERTNEEEKDKTNGNNKMNGHARIRERGCDITTKSDKVNEHKSDKARTKESDNINEQDINGVKEKINEGTTDKKRNITKENHIVKEKVGDKVNEHKSDRVKAKESDNINEQDINGVKKKINEGTKDTKRNITKENHIVKEKASDRVLEKVSDIKDEKDSDGIKENNHVKERSNEETKENESKISKIKWNTTTIVIIIALVIIIPVAIFIAILFLK